jgi:hypothetical protein
VSAYHRLPIGAKRSLASERQAEPPLRCPSCSVATPARDLLAHLAARCPGPPAPHVASRWLSTHDVLALGVSAETLDGWRARGLVRVREGDELQLLARDVVQLVAMLRVLGETAAAPATSTPEHSIVRQNADQAQHEDDSEPTDHPPPGASGPGTPDPASTGKELRADRRDDRSKNRLVHG